MVVTGCRGAKELPSSFKGCFEETGGWAGPLEVHWCLKGEKALSMDWSSSGALCMGDEKESTDGPK